MKYYHYCDFFGFVVPKKEVRFVEEATSRGCTNEEKANSEMVGDNEASTVSADSSMCSIEVHNTCDGVQATEDLTMSRPVNEVHKLYLSSDMSANNRDNAEKVCVCHANTIVDQA